MADLRHEGLAGTPEAPVDAGANLSGGHPKSVSRITASSDGDLAAALGAPAKLLAPEAHGEKSVIARCVVHHIP
jgi:hypothetical protein